MGRPIVGCAVVFNTVRIGRSLSRRAVVNAHHGSWEEGPLHGGSFVSSVPLVGSVKATGLDDWRKVKLGESLTVACTPSFAGCC